jgi:hypothetical protein
MVDMYVWQSLCAARGKSMQEMRRTDPFFRKDLVRWWPKLNAAARAKAKEGWRIAVEDTAAENAKVLAVFSFGQGLGLPDIYSIHRACDGEFVGSLTYSRTSEPTVRMGVQGHQLTDKEVQWVFGFSRWRLLQAAKQD